MQSWQVGGDFDPQLGMVLEQGPKSWPQQLVRHEVDGGNRNLKCLYNQGSLMAYTGFIPVTIQEDSEAADIPSMREMPDVGYSNYLDGGLFFTDHHDVLRAVHGGYPIATTSRQVDLLVEYLEGIKSRMVSAGS